MELNLLRRTSAPMGVGSCWIRTSVHLLLHLVLHLFSFSTLVTELTLFVCFNLILLSHHNKNTN